MPLTGVFNVFVKISNPEGNCQLLDNRKGCAVDFLVEVEGEDVCHS